MFKKNGFNMKKDFFLIKLLSFFNYLLMCYIRSKNETFSHNLFNKFSFFS